MRRGLLAPSDAANQLQGAAQTESPSADARKTKGGAGRASDEWE
jgi:hypothetical protein